MNKTMVGYFLSPSLSLRVYRVNNLGYDIRHRVAGRLPRRQEDPCRTHGAQHRHAGGFAVLAVTPHLFSDHRLQTSDHRLLEKAA